MRNNFMELKNECLELAQTQRIESNSKQTRLHRVKKRFDELIHVERIKDNEKRFQVEMYNQLLGILIT